MFLSFPSLLKRFEKQVICSSTDAIFRASYLGCVSFEKHLIFKQCKTVASWFCTILLDMDANSRDSANKNHSHII